jgi:hypothetical protein
MHLMMVVEDHEKGLYLEHALVYFFAQLLEMKDMARMKSSVYLEE